MDDRNQLFHAALYVRRKFYGTTKPEEPDPSPADQLKTMKEYLKDFPDVKITGVYMEVRKTGPEHPRPQFYQMMDDIRDGRYTCVVMYSLSVFAKDMKENRYYIQSLFLPRQIRIISILDQYDSFTSEPEPDTFSRLKKLFARKEVCSDSLPHPKQDSQQKRGQRDSSAYLMTSFRGLVSCGHCGNRLIRSKCRNNEESYYVYTCPCQRTKSENACPLPPIRLSDLFSAAQTVLEKEQFLALETREKIKKIETSNDYRQLDERLQAQVRKALELGKQDMEKRLALSDSDQKQKAALETESLALRKSLVAAVEQKQTFKSVCSVHNPWVKLYTELEKGFAITPAIARKYIAQLYLFQNSPPVLITPQQDAKESLFSYLSFFENGKWEKQADHPYDPNPGMKGGTRHDKTGTSGRPENRMHKSPEIV